MDVDECIRHGWRFLRLKPCDVLEMSYREFSMICEENVERTHDENERSAMIAIMNAAASRGKGKKGALPKVSDLYKRPSEQEQKQTQEDIREQYEHTKDWLAQFDLSSIDE